MRPLVVGCLAVTAAALRIAPLTSRAPHKRTQRFRPACAQYQYDYTEQQQQAQYQYADTEQQQPALPAPWEQHFDETTGHVYYANPQSGVTQWDPPTEYASQDIQLEQGTLTEAKRLLDQLPAGWVTGFDDSSGATYYCHDVSGECQWEVPPTSPGGPQDAAPQGRATQVVWRVVSVKGWGPRFSGKYTLRPDGTSIAVLGRYDMETSKPTRPYVSREQCAVQLHSDGSATLESRGKPPTLFRNRGGGWYALQRGDCLTLTDGDQIGLDYNDPEGTVFTCGEERA